MVGLSSQTGRNVEAFVEEVVYFLPEGPRWFPADMETDQPIEVMVAEFIREKVLRSFYDEVPHSIGVQVEEMVYEESGLARLVREAYRLLGLQSYFTSGETETRAWTIPIGAKAPQAAGVIHTDFERGFIKAETASFDDYVALGGEKGCRDAGKLRQEGKEYVVQDGDVMHFKFNV